MKITRPIEFNEAYIPRFCRNPRYRRVQAEVTAEIKEVTSAEAPLAIVQRGDCKWSRTGSRNHIDYRWCDDRLWVRPRHSHFVAISAAEDRMARPNDIYIDRWIGCTTPQEAQEGFQRRMNQYLLIDGKLYIEEGEPRYYVSTGGLGCNHGGTWLSTDNSYNPNIPWSRYFRCDNLKEALALHKKIAKARGDTKSIPSRHHARFKVLMPEVLSVDPQTQHGEGDDFLNKAETIIEGCKDTTLSAFALMAVAFGGH